MRRYYFDLRDNGTLGVDDGGTELPDLRAVQIEAARALVDMVNTVIWEQAETVLGHRIAIEVRNDNGPVLQEGFTLELERHQH